MPSQIVEVVEDRSDVKRKLPGDALVQASADSWLDLDLARQMPGRVVYALEYTLKTRLDILRVSDRPLLRELRTLLWELRTERCRVEAIVARLDTDRDRLATMSDVASAFSRTRYFEDVFRARIEQFKALARRNLSSAG